MLPPRLVGVLHVAHLQERVRTVQVRRRRIDRRSGLLARLDELLQLQVHEAIHVPARSHRRHAACEVQPDETLAELPVDAGPRRVIEVLVHHDEAGDHRFAGEVEDRGALRRPDAGGVTHLGDVAAAD